MAHVVLSAFHAYYEIELIPAMETLDQILLTRKKHATDH